MPGYPRFVGPVPLLGSSTSTTMAAPLDEAGVRAIEEGPDRFRRWLGLPEDDEEDTDDDQP